MKLIAVVVSLALFLAAFPLFSYAFWVPEEWAAIMFFTGIMSATLALAIPLSILGRRD